MLQVQSKRESVSLLPALDYLQIIISQWRRYEAQDWLYDHGISPARQYPRLT